MTSLTSAPMLFVELLADRSQKPSALLLDFRAGQAEAFLPLVAHPDFLALTSRFTCLFLSTDTLAPDALRDAGCRPMNAETLHRTASPVDKALPPAAQWVAGDWYFAPPAKPSGNQAVSRALALQLVQLVCADADTHEIEAVLRRDPALSYHLLRLVNSLGMGLGKRITSFSQAILILGRAQLRRWLNLMLFSSREGDVRSAMLLARVAVRARTMELLAKSGGIDKSGQELAFMAGMFSLLGILFGLPLVEVLKPLKVSDALLAAVLTHEGELGRLLQLVESAERRDAAALSALLDAAQLPHAEFNLLTIQAYGWMLDVVRNSREGANG